MVMDDIALTAAFLRDHLPDILLRFDRGHRLADRRDVDTALTMWSECDARRRAMLAGVLQHLPGVARDCPHLFRGGFWYLRYDSIAMRSVVSPQFGRRPLDIDQVDKELLAIYIAAANPEANGSTASDPEAVPITTGQVLKYLRKNLNGEFPDTKAALQWCKDQGVTIYNRREWAETFRFKPRVKGNTSFVNLRELTRAVASDAAREERTENQVTARMANLPS